MCLWFAFFPPKGPLRYTTKQDLLYFYPCCLQSLSSTIFCLFACTTSRTFQGPTLIWPEKSAVAYPFTSGNARAHLTCLWMFPSSSSSKIHALERGNLRCNFCMHENPLCVTEWSIHRVNNVLGSPLSWSCLVPSNPTSQKSPDTEQKQTHHSYAII